MFLGWEEFSSGFPAWLGTSDPTGNSCEMSSPKPETSHWAGGEWLGLRAPPG